MLNLNDHVLAVSEETFSLYLFPKYGKVTEWTDELIKGFFKDFLLMNKKSLELYFDDADKVLEELLSIENRKIDYLKMLEELQMRFFPLKDKSNVNTIIDKQIDYSFHLKHLQRVFKSSKIVVLVRDPRDNVEACIRRKMGRSMSVAYQAALWKSHYIEFLNYLDNEDFLAVKYEDMILKPKETLVMVCDHLSIPFEEKMLEHEGVFEQLIGSRAEQLDPQFESEIRKFHDGLLSPKDSSKIGKYKKAFSDSEIATIEMITGDVAGRYGYHFSSPPVSISVKDRCLMLLAELDRSWLLKFYYRIPVFVKLWLKKGKKDIHR